MKRQRKKRTIIFVSTVFLCFLFFSYYFGIASPIIKTYCSAQTRALTEKAINLAVSNVINRSISYDDLININYNSNSEIISFSANQYEINTITREIVKEAQNQMNNVGEEGLLINSGTLSGISFFIGKGPKIRLNLVPVGEVTSDFLSEFNSVGINMTKHTLLLNIKVHVSIVLPIQSYEIYSTNQVLLAESIILGKVPEVYFSNGMLK